MERKIPEYKFPRDKFFPIKNRTIIDKKAKKRYVLEIRIKTIRKGNDRWLVILKNPSRAGEKNIEYSDKTVNNVCEYFNKRMKKVSTVVIMNLFPVYETYSQRLKDLRKGLIDKKNKKLLKNEINKANGIVFAWGSHPPYCKQEFDEMKEYIFSLLKGKDNVYEMTKNGKKLKNPLHGQVWGHKINIYKLKKRG